MGSDVALNKSSIDANKIDADREINRVDRRVMATEASIDANKLEANTKIDANKVEADTKITEVDTRVTANKAAIDVNKIEAAADIKKVDDKVKDNQALISGNKAEGDNKIRALDDKVDINAKMAAADKVETENSIKTVDGKVNENKKEIVNTAQHLEQFAGRVNDVAEQVDVNTAMSMVNRRRIGIAELRIDNLETRVHGVEQKVKRLDRNVSGFMAQSAAMSSLITPMSPGKTSVSAGFGTSGSAQAFAIGAGRRINEALSVKLNAAYDNVSKQVTAGAGVGFEF